MGSKNEPIQAKLFRRGRRKDVIGQAQTGTGKTSRSRFPSSKRETAKQTHPGNHTLPYRELAIQVSEEIKRVSSTRRMLRLPFMEPAHRAQLRVLRCVHIVIGTRRTIDHINRAPEAG